jgi:glycosyltransferase involved in cell wall biosynthesis
MPQTRFWIVGAEIFPENQGRQALLRVAAARLGLEDRARFLGQRNDMPAIMDALDLLVAAAEAEACSRAVLEAMAAGTPVVAADAGGNPELVVHGETGLLFAPRDAQALAAALRILIRDAEARRRLGRAARARVEEQFSIQRQVREIEAVYEAVLSGA